MLENKFEIFYTEGWRENIIIRYFFKSTKNYIKN